MKPICRILISCMVLILSFNSCEKDENNPKRKWTIIGYFDGNNSLDNLQSGTSYIIDDLQEMESVGSTEQVTSIVMLSTLKTGGNASYYYIEKHQDQLPDQIKSNKIEDLGTKDMSDTKTLTDFIGFCVDNYPADNYALILNSHGGGWVGVCPDEKNGSGDFISIPELGNALSEGPYFDIVIFHSCLMGMIEVAYEIKDYADYMVASEINMPALSVLGADIWLKELVENPNLETLELSKKICQSVYEKGAFSQKETQMSVIDLTKIKTVSASIANLGNRINTEANDSWNEVFNCWRQTYYLDEFNNYPSYTDIRDFVKQVEQNDFLSSSNLIRVASEEVISSLNIAIPFNKHYVGESEGLPLNGLSIHLPAYEEDLKLNKYNKLAFKETNWHNFITNFVININENKSTQLKKSRK